MHNLNRSALHGIESNVRDIVEKGVTQKEKDYALINACRNNHTKVVKYLLDKGANVNCKDSNQQTPLNHAAYYSRVETVELLMDHGANRYHRNKWNHMIGEVFDPKVKEAMQKKVKAALNGYRTGRSDPLSSTPNKQQEKKGECCNVCSVM
ncbi:unnamed protein product [Heterosigma akashiwo]|mmetsp:Transcript_20566/g.28374  ORF Transcript_20566/g.28374 Transcript_20566/m.28374 type:complete len:151 (+) Transcript_20566:74-526(+)|eukprot:CAMPEP_0194724096 /NCGR_PEP_ID=MMETSP0296-20130528/18453_1 /TAXON_ID=39354 /ORGANISM="Heterosigma akashiwo, Strain CCMP2393" /LENGTH=150 /DNA_ID=CAMNT_0039627895 /DNA_START=88 /DNA_END=540 /DNA_ORIENTATION=+